MDLVEFLRARLDEDERTASDVHNQDCDWFSPISFGCDCGVPVRLLAEVKAKRDILAEHYIIHRDIGWLDEERDEAYGELPVCGLCVPKHSHFATRDAIPVSPCRTVRLLALPYADRQDYQPEWKP